MATPKWMTSFQYLRYSLRSEDSRKVFNLLWGLIKDETTTYRVFRLVGLFQGFFSILEFFASHAGMRRRGRRWRDTHSSQVVEDMLKEILASKRKSLEGRGNSK